MKTQAWVVALALSVMLTACGGGGGETSSSEAPTEGASQTAAGISLDEWLDQALAECKTVNQATTEAEPKGDPFSPEATAADREQGITFLETFGTSLAAFANNLREAGLPTEETAAAEDLVAAAEKSGKAFDDAAATAKEDFAKAQPAVGAAFGSLGELEGAAAKVGIGDLETCKRKAKKVEQAAPGANEVPVVATKKGGKYTFEFAKSIPAGKTAFVMANEDDEAHFMALMQVKGRGALAKALQAEAAGKSDEADKFIVSEDVGGSEDAAPGEQAVANVNLKPGTYGMMCFIPGPDGKPHAFSGMAVEFTVTK